MAKIHKDHALLGPCLELLWSPLAQALKITSSGTTKASLRAPSWWRLT